MQMPKNKTTTTIALILMFAMAFSLVLLPIASAHDPPWKIPTTAFMSVSPDPVGVGQTVFIVVWLDRTMPGATITNDLRMHNYKLTITRPDGKTDIVEWPIASDPTSAAFTLYTPTQVGTYTLNFSYLGQVFTWSGAYQNDIYLPSSRQMTLTVQEEPIPEAITSYPLPTEYWTRPIEGQNTDWWAISSNWLGSGDPYLGGYRRKIQPYGSAPNSAHIMWTKPIQDGGIVGGDGVGVPGNTFYMGLTYNRRFGCIIMHGRLYYQKPYGNSGGGGGWMCVDLRTGEEIWYSNQMGVSGTGIPSPSFGYYYAYEMYNQHGIVPEGWLFSSGFGYAYEPSTGRISTLNITNVPSGTAVKDYYGAHLRYQMSYAGRWLAQWNSSKVFNVQTSGNIPANCPITPARPSGMYWNGSTWVTSTERSAQGYASVTTPAYDWNKTIPDLPGLASPAIIDGKYNDMIFGRSASYPGSLTPSLYGTTSPITHWAISTKEGEEGRLLWIKNYTFPNNNTLTYLFGMVDFESRVWTIWCKETLQWYGYSLDNGNLLWGPSERTLSDWDYYEPETTAMAVYGKLYHSGYGGVLYCYDMKTGVRLWTYGNGGPGNNTYSGGQVIYGRYPIMPEIAADGKIYLTTTEHSPNTPLFKGSRLRCINATDGTELWTILHYGGTYGGFGPQAGIADGYLAILNQYDYNIYVFGKGPSATTVTASPKVSVHGDSVLVEGTVIDIAAGTKQKEQAARFPNGVPAVSDKSMSEWMEYVYMQKPRPADATGVEVVLSVLDPNNNSYEVGRTTSDANGMFSHAFTPEVPGKYTIIATFAGSESYWPSHAETAINVEEAPPATPPPEYPVPADYTLTIIGAAIAVIIAVAIATILILRKRS